MASTKLIAKTLMISLAIVCVLTVAMIPLASASYGDVQRFLHPSPSGLGQAKIWDIYWDAVDPETPPGRICTIFTLGAADGANYGVNSLTSDDALIIGVAGIYVASWFGYDHKSARDYYNNWETHLYFDGKEIDIEITPMRTCHYKDEFGFQWIWWEWRIGATFKKGELALGLYEFRQTFVEYGTVIFDTDLVSAPYYFEIV